MSATGYVRVSNNNENTALQLDGLRAAGRGNLFKDTASVAKTARPDPTKDTRTSRGRPLAFHMFKTLAEFNCDSVRETHVDLRAAKRHGHACAARPPSRKRSASIERRAQLKAGLSHRRIDNMPMTAKNRKEKH